MWLIISGKWIYLLDDWQNRSPYLIHRRVSGAFWERHMHLTIPHLRELPWVWKEYCWMGANICQSISLTVFFTVWKHGARPVHLKIGTIHISDIDASYIWNVYGPLFLSHYLVRINVSYLPTPVNVTHKVACVLLFLHLLFSLINLC